MADGYNLGSAYGSIVIDASGVSAGIAQAKKALGGLSGSLKSLGGELSSVGGAMVGLTAPLVAGFGLAVKSAVDFDKAMTNVGAVLGKSAEDMSGLRDEILALGANSTAGPQAVAEAFYDIVGGVADASTHMDILKAAMSTADAGAADLGATTNALISIMNSYKFSAEEAVYASDVLTRTVGMGVGTMDEFAAALPQVTGLANSLGISFGNVGAMAAYLTTQGNSASQSVTQLSAMMTALLNPNETMKTALSELGYTTGQAAIESLGLYGAYQALQGTQTANTEGMARMTGSVEALRGITALITPEFAQFSATFAQGIQGATEAAKNIQLESASTQFAQLQSQISAAAVELGTALLPSLQQLAADVMPVIQNVIAWIQQNPELVAQIAQITLVVGILGGGLTILGTVITSVGTILGVLQGAVTLASTLFGALTGTAGAAGAAVGGAGVASTAALPAFVALAAPIVAVTAAAVAAVVAVKQLIDTINMVQGAAASANAQIAPLVQSGQISEQDVYDQSFRAVQAQWGDLAARLFYTNFANSALGKASGGSVYAGSPYIVGERGPEMFIPNSSGSIIPNHKLGGGDTYNIALSVPVEVLRDTPNLERNAASFADAFKAAMTRKG